jgi:hypothetical protein
VASLLLAAPGGALLAEVTPELRTFFDAEGAALERGDLDAAVEANLTWWVEGPRRRASEVEPAVRDLVARMQRRAFEVTAGWDDVEQKELEPPALERLGEIAAPALVLVGGLDLDAVQAAAGRVVDGVAGARRVDWPDAGHLPALERPADFLALLRGWAAPLPGALLAGVDQANRQRAVDPLQQRAGERRMQRRRPAMRLVHQFLRRVPVAGADQDGSQALIGGGAVELREVRRLGSHTHPTRYRGIPITGSLSQGIGAQGTQTSRRVARRVGLEKRARSLGRHGPAGDLARLNARGADVQALGRTGNDGPNGLDVRVPTAAGTDVRPRDVVAEARPLAANVADGSHGCLHK